VATKPTSPLDATGRAAEEAAKRNAKALADRKDEIALSRAAEEELLETAVFDPKKPDAPILIDEIEEVGVSLKNEKVVIRTHHDIEDMTYGVINGTPQSYTFKAGVKYSVPKDLALYLQGLGYLWIA
jgi:ferritin-like protein